MSKEAAAKWIVKLHEDEGLRKQAEATGSFEARQSLASEHGFVFTKEEIEHVVSLHKAELSDDELDAVSGGASENNDSIETDTSVGQILAGVGIGVGGPAAVMGGMGGMVAIVAAAL